MALDQRNMSPCLLCRVNASAKKSALSLRARVRGVPPGATVIATISDQHADPVGDGLHG